MPPQTSPLQSLITVAWHEHRNLLQNEGWEPDTEGAYTDLGETAALSMTKGPSQEVLVRQRCGNFPWLYGFNI